MPSTIIPCLRYRDTHAAIAWLEQALGFTAHSVFEGPGHTIAHAQLTLGDGMIMVGSASNEGGLAEHLRQPDQLNLIETQSPYVVVPDATATHQAVLNAGGTIVGALTEMSYGGMAFSCRDPEGHLWSLGEYDPWPPTPA